MEDIRGKVAIITGASSGIGYATTKEFLAHGAKVLGVGRVSCPEEFAPNPDFCYFRINLTLPGASERVVQACTEAFGDRIDVLLNIAGIKDNWAGVQSVTDDDWESVNTINVTVPVRLTRAVIPRMRKYKSGAIVNISSRAGLGGGIAGISYTTSKHAIIGVTKSVAWNFKTEGIRCNAICPGGFKTSIQDRLDPSRLDMEALERYKPVHQTHLRVSSRAVDGPEEPARLILFLSSDISRHVNGAIIPIDNAWSIA